MLAKKIKKMLRKAYAPSLPVIPKKSPPAFKGKLHGFSAELNEGNTYPSIAAAFPLFNAPLVQIVHFLAQKLKRSINVIDVGAAFGDTVLLLEQRCGGMVKEYLCIDGDAEFGVYLHKNVSPFKKVRIVQTMLAGERMEVPELVKHHKGSAGCFGDKKVNARPLDEIVAGESFKPDLLKIDVDGFDGEVLRGAKNLLSQDKPVVIFEWHPKLYANAGQDYKLPFHILNDHGYGQFVWFDNTGEFSHFSAQMTDGTLSLMNDYLMRVNRLRDQHFDVIALLENDMDNLVSLAVLAYAREATIKHPAL